MPGDPKGEWTRRRRGRRRPSDRTRRRPRPPASTRSTKDHAPTGVDDAEWAGVVGTAAATCSAPWSSCASAGRCTPSRPPPLFAALDRRRPRQHHAHPAAGGDGAVRARPAASPGSSVAATRRGRPRRRARPQPARRRRPRRPVRRSFDRPLRPGPADGVPGPVPHLRLRPAHRPGHDLRLDVDGSRPRRPRRRPAVGHLRRGVAAAAPTGPARPDAVPVETVPRPRASPT